jgi:hypothetical protein
VKDRGSALMTSVIAISILLLISGIFFSIVISQWKLESSEEKALKTFYIAEAGVQSGIAQIIGLNNPPLSEPIQGLINGGTFTVQIVNDGEGNYTITSTGTYSGVTRRLQAGYTYSKTP